MLTIRSSGSIFSASVPSCPTGGNASWFGQTAVTKDGIEDKGRQGDISLVLFDRFLNN